MQDHQKKFKIHDIVWAKLWGFPWWPAIVYDYHDDQISFNNSKNTYVVIYFGEYTHSYLKQSKIAKYYQNYEKHSQMALSTKRLKQAIIQADKFIEKNSHIFGTEQVAEKLNDFLKKALSMNKPPKANDISVAEKPQVLEQKVPQNVGNNKPLQNIEQQQQYLIKYQKKGNQKRKNQSDIPSSNPYEINTQNILQLLENKALENWKCTLDQNQYLSKKLELKNTLLQKYNLQYSKSITKGKIPKTKKIEKKKSTFSKQNSNLNSNILRQRNKKLYILKIFTQLKERKLQPVISKQISIYLVNKIIHLQANCFKDQFLNLIRWIQEKNQSQIYETYQQYAELLTQFKSRIEDQSTNTKGNEILEV